jgi:hypothetical protein
LELIDCFPPWHYQIVSKGPSLLIADITFTSGTLCVLAVRNVNEDNRAQITGIVIRSTDYYDKCYRLFAPHAKDLERCTIPSVMVIPDQHAVIFTTAGDLFH